MGNNENIAEMEREAVYDILPVTTKDKQYGFWEGFFFLGSYAVATWNYTQGAYLATLTSFKQVLIAALLASLLMMGIFELPVILSTRFGIDIWVWMKSVLGHTGVRVVTVLICLLNLPWHAVCCQMFASSMISMIELTGVTVPRPFYYVFGIACMVIGLYIALKGLKAITKTTNILTPALIAVGIVVLIVGFASAPVDFIWNYTPVDITSGAMTGKFGYTLAIDAMFAFSLSWFPGMAGVPRISKKEKTGYWAGVCGQAIIGPFYIIIGAVMAIATEYKLGEMSSDPTIMLANLAFPALALLSLLLVGAANFGTNATVAYLYSAMLKTSFPKMKYRVLATVISTYIIIIFCWGKIIDYLGVFLTIGACVFGPLAALLITDFFFVRKQKFSMRAAYSVDGNKKYNYFFGFNPIGVFCTVLGLATSLIIYNPVKGIVHIQFLFDLTPTAVSMVVTGVVYVLLNKIPAIRKYNLNDRDELTIV